MALFVQRSPVVVSRGGIVLLAFDDYELDSRLWELRKKGRRVAVQGKALELLFHLAQNRDRLIPKEELVEVLWPGAAVSDAALSQAVKKARSAVGDMGGSQCVIRTIRGVGLRFVAATTERARTHGSKERTGPAVTATVPSPQPRDRSLIGRQAELAAAEGALASALAGSGRVLFLEGEAGIGKTRLAQAIADRALSQGAVVEEGWCHREFRAACAPWSQILTELVADRSEQELSELLGAGGPYVAQLVPELAGRFSDLANPPPLQPEEARYRLFDAVGSFFAGVAQQVPLVLVLEDLHWADGESLKLLELLLRRLRTRSMLVVGTYRAEEVDAAHPLAVTLGEVDRHDLATTLRLDNLSREEIAGFVTEEAEIEPSPDLLDALYERTQGNPYFLAQVLDLLQAEGPVGSSESGSLDAQDWLRMIPPAVQQVLTHRFARISEGTRRILTVASLCGAEFDALLVERVCRVTRADLLDNLEEAERARLVNEVAGTVSRFRFVHTLAREALEDDLSNLRRAELHAEIGACAEALYGENVEAHLGELAYHYCEGARAKHADKAAEYAERAGREAMRRGIYEEGSLQFERGLRALDLLPSPQTTRRYALLMEVARARHGLGNHVRAREAYREAAEQARAAGACDAFAEAALGFAALPDNTGEVDVACVDILRQALDAVGQDGSPSLRARLTTRLAVFQLGRPEAREEAKDLLASAAEIARTVAGSDATLEELLARVHVLRVSGEPNPVERLALSREAAALAESSGAEVHGMIARCQQITPLLELGDRAGADRTIADFRCRAKKLRIPAWLWLVPQHHAMLMLLDGAFEDVEETAAESLPIAAQIPGSVGPIVHGLILCALRREQGRLDELVDFGGALAAKFPKLTLISALLVLQMAESGRREDAARLLEGEAFRDWVGRDGWRAAAGVLADACAELGDIGRARLLYELLEPSKDHNLVVGEGNLFLGPVARGLGRLAGLLERWDESQAHFEYALALCRETRTPPWEARTRLSYAQTLLARGSGTASRAVELLQSARAIATRHGMTAVLHDIGILEAGSLIPRDPRSQR